MDAPGADVISEAIIRQGVRAAGYNRAPNAALIQRLKDGGVVCVPTCGAVKHAAKAEQLGADIIIVQGGEGGGHTGSIPTSLLAPAAADAVTVPVVAAGGFKDGRGLVAALAFGCEGVAMGTRFLMTAESPVPTASFERYLHAQMSDVVVSTALDGLPQRMVANELLRKLESAGPHPQALDGAPERPSAAASETGASIPELLRSGLAMRRNQKLTNAQMIMAANAPILARIGVDRRRSGERIPGQRHRRRRDRRSTDLRGARAAHRRGGRADAEASLRRARLAHLRRRAPGQQSERTA